MISHSYDSRINRLSAYFNQTLSISDAILEICQFIHLISSDAAWNNVAMFSRDDSFESLIITIDHSRIEFGKLIHKLSLTIPFEYNEWLLIQSIHPYCSEEASYQLKNALKFLSIDQREAFSQAIENLLINEHPFVGYIGHYLFNLFNLEKSHDEAASEFQALNNLKSILANDYREPQEFSQSVQEIIHCKSPLLKAFSINLFIRKNIASQVIAETLQLILETPSCEIKAWTSDLIQQLYAHGQCRDVDHLFSKLFFKRCPDLENSESIFKSLNEFFPLFYDFGHKNYKAWQWSLLEEADPWEKIVENLCILCNTTEILPLVNIKKIVSISKMIMTQWTKSSFYSSENKIHQLQQLFLNSLKLEHLDLTIIFIEGLVEMKGWSETFGFELKKITLSNDILFHLSNCLLNTPLIFHSNYFLILIEKLLKTRNYVSCVQMAYQLLQASDEDFNAPLWINFLEMLIDGDPIDKKKYVERWLNHPEELPLKEQAKYWKLILNIAKTDIELLFKVLTSSYQQLLSTEKDAIDCFKMVIVQVSRLSLKDQRAYGARLKQLQSLLKKTLPNEIVTQVHTALSSSFDQLNLRRTWEEKCYQLQTRITNHRLQLQSISPDLDGLMNSYNNNQSSISPFIDLIKACLTKKTIRFEYLRVIEFLFSLNIKIANDMAAELIFKILDQPKLLESTDTKSKKNKKVKSPSVNPSSRFKVNLRKLFLCLEVSTEIRKQIISCIDRQSVRKFFEKDVEIQQIKIALEIPDLFNALQNNFTSSSFNLELTHTTLCRYLDTLYYMELQDVLYITPMILHLKKLQTYHFKDPNDLKEVEQFHQIFDSLEYYLQCLIIRNSKNETSIEFQLLNQIHRLEIEFCLQIHCPKSLIVLALKKTTKLIQSKLILEQEIYEQLVLLSLIEDKTNQIDTTSINLFSTAFNHNYFTNLTNSHFYIIYLIYDINQSPIFFENSSSMDLTEMGQIVRETVNKFNKSDFLKNVLAIEGTEINRLSYLTNRFDSLQKITLILSNLDVINKNLFQVTLSNINQELYIINTRECYENCITLYNELSEQAYFCFRTFAKHLKLMENPDLDLQYSIFNEFILNYFNRLTGKILTMSLENMDHKLKSMHKLIVFYLKMQIASWLEHQIFKDENLSIALVSILLTWLRDSENEQNIANSEEQSLKFPFPKNNPLKSTLDWTYRDITPLIINFLSKKAVLNRFDDAFIKDFLNLIIQHIREIFKKSSDEENLNLTLTFILFIKTHIKALEEEKRTPYLEALKEFGMSCPFGKTKKFIEQFF